MLCCYLELGTFLRVVARYFLPIHSSTIRPARFHLKQASVQPDPWSPSYAAASARLKISLSTVERSFPLYAPDIIHKEIMVISGRLTG